MASSYLTESEAPRDFRISSTESEGHYTKCLLCYTVRKNFYCPDCIRTGNFVHSSMPYADRFSEKQGKLLRLKANRKHTLDRCEKLLAHQLKRDSLATAAAQARDALQLLRLAIEQRRGRLDDRRKQLTELTQLNTELRLKLPRYGKRVSSVAAHAAAQRRALHAAHGAAADRGAALAALRRHRVRQLTTYIFPVHVTEEPRYLQLPRYKRVSAVAAHGAAADRGAALAALRRHRVRQLTTYIFPVHVTEEPRYLQLPRYKRVSAVAAHGAAADRGAALAALRRHRVRQLTTYIFPVHVTEEPRYLQLPRYKRVSAVAAHGAAADRGAALAALRRHRVRQLTTYIFPVHVTEEPRYLQLPRYKRVSAVAAHGAAADRGAALAALRRHRVRQLTTYIFPVHVTEEPRYLQLPRYKRVSAVAAHGAAADRGAALAALRRHRVRQLTTYIFPVHVTEEPRYLQLPRYKRVSAVAAHGAAADRGAALAALRRHRVRQLTTYIFPVHVTEEPRYLQLPRYKRVSAVAAHGAAADRGAALAALRRHRVRQLTTYIFPVHVTEEPRYLQLPRYKRVSAVAAHGAAADRGAALAALRRHRVRQLTTYIFPVHVTEEPRYLQLPRYKRVSAVAAHGAAADRGAALAALRRHRVRQLTTYIFPVHVTEEPRYLQLPRYKRVSAVAAHGAAADRGAALAALRRHRVRQLTTYIFPVHVTEEPRYLQLPRYKRVSAVAAHGAAADREAALAALRRHRVRQLTTYIFPVHVTEEPRYLQLPRYKRVSAVAAHGAAADRGAALAALRRHRVRQLTTYIFPVHVTEEPRYLQLPRYKRVSAVAAHGAAADRGAALAALRRHRVRQLTTYIFPVHVTEEPRYLQLPRYKRVSAVAAHGAAADRGAALAALRRHRVRQLTTYIFPVHVTEEPRYLQLPRYKRVSAVAAHGAAADRGAALAALRRHRVRQLTTYIFPVHVTEEPRYLQLPRYKRVSAVAAHGAADDRGAALAALRRHRVRQLTTYIFPVHVTEEPRYLQLPRYKRVSAVAAHGAAADRGAALAALRRHRVRQLTTYIFPVHVTEEPSDSIEDMEFVGGECGLARANGAGGGAAGGGAAGGGARLHVVAPWLGVDGDHAHALLWAKQNKEASLTAEPAEHPLHRTVAALGLAAQLLALLAWALDARLPHALALSDYCNWRVSEGGLRARSCRVGACAAALCARAGLAPPPRLAALPALAAAAAADHPGLGRVEAWTPEDVSDVSDACTACASRAPGEPCAACSPCSPCSPCAACAAWDTLELPDEPEHLHWPEQEEEPAPSRSPPAAAPAPPPAPASLVTSLASMWRGWTK